MDSSRVISRLMCVPPAQVTYIWSAVAPMIDAAYAEMDLPTPDVRTWLLEERGLLWVAAYNGGVVACATTSIVEHRSGRCCRIVAAGGEGSGLELWKIHIGAIEAYAQAEGCVKVKFEGRQGWGRILTGYAPKSIALEKRLAR
jgi:hypothetical protein